MGLSKDYNKKLKDPKWFKRREEILDRDKHICTRCGVPEGQTTLHVHHTKYFWSKKGNPRDPWDYSDEFLITLCALCHLLEHKKRKQKPTVKKKTRAEKNKKRRAKYARNKKKRKPKKTNYGIQGKNFKPRKLTKKEQADLRKRIQET